MSKPPLFRQSLLCTSFSWTPPPLIVEFFSGRPKYQSFSSLTPSDLLKVTKVLVKISQFEFFPILFINFFLSLNISDFSFFVGKIANLPWEKLPSSFSATPLSKWRSCQIPIFENLVGGSTPPSRKGRGGGGEGVCGHYDNCQKQPWFGNFSFIIPDDSFK